VLFFFALKGEAALYISLYVPKLGITYCNVKSSTVMHFRKERLLHSGGGTSLPPSARYSHLRVTRERKTTRLTCQLIALRDLDMHPGGIGVMVAFRGHA